MKRSLKLTESELSRIIKRVISEQDEFDIEKTIMDTTGFKEEEIPSECLENPSLSELDSLQKCIGKITEKSTALNNALKTLTDRLNTAKSESSSVSESRIRRRKF